jgi:hypothetical protein
MTYFASLSALVRLTFEPLSAFALGFECLAGGASGRSSSSTSCSSSVGVSRQSRMGRTPGVFTTIQEPGFAG